ncbi:MAG: hypothetical protein U9P70_04025 [Patescibacteria group bacterium]|nr:hypothetical protein [Patescibacteria group bacterium]
MQDFFKSLFIKFEITIGSTARSLPRTAMRGDYGANNIIYNTIFIEFIYIIKVCFILTNPNSISFRIPLLRGVRGVLTSFLTHPQPPL